MTRAAALLLVMALIAPLAALVVCEWSCASEHAPVTTAADSGCHEHGMPSDLPSVASVHVCHDLAEAAATVITPVRSLDGPPAVVVSAEASAHSGDHVTGSSGASTVSRPPGFAVLLHPLRI